jgi:hypothetical protein
MVVGFVNWRHLTLAEDVINLAPSVEITTGKEIGIQFVNPESSLGLFRTMAVDTGLYEKRGDDPLIVFKIGRRNRPRGADQGGPAEECND